jgi:aminoglycoside phosphotransferase (APT) family kinase protein
MIKPEQLAGYLSAKGLLAVSKVMNGKVSVLEASRRNLNYQIHSGNRQDYFVKQGSYQVDGSAAAGTVDYESDVLDALEPYRAGWRYLIVPRKFAFDRHHRLLVLELFDGTENLRHYHARTGRLSTRLSASLGAALAELHSTPVRDAAWLASRLPDVFTLSRPSLDLLRGASAGNAALLTFIQRFPAIAEGLEALADEWRAKHLIHGDPRWDNWLVPLSRSQRKPVLVDWEFAMLGDPAWDVGCLAGEYLSSWILSVPEVSGLPFEEAVALASCPFDAARSALRALWAAYRVGRSTSSWNGNREMELIIRHAAAKLLDVASERMVQNRQLTAQIGVLLQLAANMFDNPGTASAQLLAAPTESAAAA